MSTRTAVRLFTVIAYREGLQQKLQLILGISISMTDALPQQICQRCARCIRAAAELRVKAHENQDWYLRRKKRTKNTTGDDASPSTVKSRPAAKRTLAPRSLSMCKDAEEGESAPGK